MDQRIFIYPKDLVVLTGKSYNRCWIAYRTLLDTLGKGKGKKITIQEYCKIEEVNEDEVKKSLSIV